MRLRHPATATGPATAEEFRCTTSALGVHDDILECPICGLLSSRPTDDPDAIAARYEEAVDRDYLAEEHERRQMFDWVLGRIEAYRIPGRRLLEIGASVGVLLSVAGERGWEAAGIEPSIWAVEHGRERFGVDLRRGSVETLEVEPRSADAVVMLDVLEHLPDPMDALRRMRSAVSDDGLLALSTVNVEGLHGRVRGSAWPWFIRAHLHYFRPRTLSRMLADAGFEIVECTTVPRTFHASYLLQRATRSPAGARLAAVARQVGDPKVPAGWMGDVTLILARPR
jgi:2-polyprenyl-3-methyl-5-hydroxy-6-metoxy-1,4-benzoquinol methylase